MYNKTDWQNLPNQTTPVVANSLNKIENGIADSYNSIGVDAYDNTATYSVGDYCIYNNTLYRCITAVTSAEEFDMSKWEGTSIQDTMKLFDNILKLDFPAIADESAPSGSNTNVATYTVPAGQTYMFIITISFPSSATGFRQVGVALNATSGNKDRHSVIRHPAVNGAQTNIQLINVNRPSTDTTYYINVYQNSGSALTVTTGLIAIRLK